MRHLSAREFVDLIEERLNEGRQNHALTCAACQKRADQLRSVRDEARAVELPEPSPLFWEHFSGRVRKGLEDVAVPAARPLLGWLRVGVPLLVGAAAVLLVVHGTARREPSTRIVELEPPAVSTFESDAVTPDPAWELISGVVIAAAWEGESGLIARPGAVDHAVGELSEDERREFVRLVELELKRAKS